jgi:uncharacterized membrane protein YebE (DUF533 family)
MMVMNSVREAGAATLNRPSDQFEHLSRESLDQDQSNSQPRRVIEIFKLLMSRAMVAAEASQGQFSR